MKPPALSTDLRELARAIRREFPTARTVSVERSLILRESRSTSAFGSTYTATITIGKIAYEAVGETHAEVIQELIDDEAP